MAIRTKMLRSVLVPLLFLFAGAGCGDSNSTEPEQEDTSGRGTIDSLLAIYLPDAYSSRDSAAYAKGLDARFSFQKLPEDPDEPSEDLYWNLEEELRIAGIMFGGRVNTDSQSVESITLNLNAGDVSPSFDTDEPDDEEWFDVVAMIDMTIVINDPDQQDGSGILNLLIDSGQKFIVTKDGPSSRGWVIVKQEDRAGIRKRSPPQASEESSWGAVKGLFRSVPLPKSGATEDASWSEVKGPFR